MIGELILDVYSDGANLQGSDIREQQSNETRMGSVG